MVRKATEYITLEENIDFAREVGLKVNTPEEFQNLFDKAIEKYGQEATVAFVPYGRYTVLTEKDN